MVIFILIVLTFYRFRRLYVARGRVNALARRRAKEARLAKGPASYLLKGVEDIQAALLADMAEVQGTVLDTLLSGHVAIQVLDGCAVL